MLVFGYETDDRQHYKKPEERDILVVPLYVPTTRYPKVVRLFFQKEGENSHYYVIKNMSRLVSSQLSKKGHKKYVCDYCLNSFGREDLLNNYTKYCSKHDAVNTMRLTRNVTFR